MSGSGWQVGQPLFRARDRRSVVALYMVGVAICAVAWVLASGEETLGEQIAPLNLALLGGLLAGAGNVMWVRRGRRALLRRRRYLLMDKALPVRRRRRTGEPAATVVAGAQLRHFHRPDCPMVVGRGWPEVSRTDAVEGQKACGVCRP